MSIFNATDALYFATVTEAINASSAGDVLMLPAGKYVEEFPLITHSLTLQGVGGMAWLTTPNPAPANDRAVLFVPFNAGADLTVRNIEITGAARPIYQNGAGILFETGNGHLQVEDSWTHDNENGILVGGSPGMTVSVLRSEFSHNGLAGWRCCTATRFPRDRNRPIAISSITVARRCRPGPTRRSTWSATSS